MKPFEENKLNVTSFLWKDRKHCWKEENAGYQHFLIFQQYFQEVPLSGSLKVKIM